MSDEPASSLAPVPRGVVTHQFLTGGVPSAGTWVNMNGILRCTDANGCIQEIDPDILEQVRLARSGARAPMGKCAECGEEEELSHPEVKEGGICLGCYCLYLERATDVTPK